MSDVANFRQQQAELEQAAQQGLNGFAIVASHESIEARHVALSQKVLDLINSGDTAGAEALVLNDNYWK